jgi:hypothetical protein
LRCRLGGFNIPSNEAPPQTDEACRGGSSRRFMTSSGRTPVSSGPIIGLYALEGAKPDDRSRADDSTKCGRPSRRSCPADGRGDRPHVPLVYVPRLQCAYGAVSFFRDHRGQPLASSALMSPMSRRFVAELDRFIARHQLPVVLFRKGQRKDDVMVTRLRLPLSIAAAISMAPTNPWSTSCSGTTISAAQRGRFAVPASPSPIGTEAFSWFCHS